MHAHRAQTRVKESDSGLHSQPFTDCKALWKLTLFGLLALFTQGFSRLPSLSFTLATFPAQSVTGRKELTIS